MIQFERAWVTQLRGSTSPEPAIRVVIQVKKFIYDAHHSLVNSVGATQTYFISITQHIIALDDDRERGPPKGQPRVLDNDGE